MPTARADIHETGEATKVTMKTVMVPNISCHHCVMTIQREVGELDGVSEIGRAHV